MSEKSSNSGKKLPIAHLVGLLGKWGIAIGGTVGVTALLMVLAGVFDSKVPETGQHHQRLLPDNAVLVQAQVLRQPRFETAVGSIEPIHQSTVSAKILAKVTEINANAGQQVKAGDVLLRLNDEDLQSRLKQAEAQRDSAVAHSQQAQLDYDRAKTLVAGNAISRAEFDARATDLRTSQAELDRATQAIQEIAVIIGYATITAPFDGIVVEKNVDVGDTVQPGQALLSLYDPNQMQLVADVRESLAMKLKVGQQVAAKLESLEHQCLATVREVVPQADRGSRSFQVKVSGPCPDGIYSGMFGRILLPLEDEELIVVPKSAVRRVGQLTLVDVANEGHMVRRSVQVGRVLGENIEILSGLAVGESVVISHQQEGTL